MSTEALWTSGKTAAIGGDDLGMRALEAMRAGDLNMAHSLRLAQEPSAPTQSVASDEPSAPMVSAKVDSPDRGGRC